MADQQIDLFTEVTENEYKFDRYYALALNRKGMNIQPNIQSSRIEDLKELLRDGYIKKIPIILPMYQMPGPGQTKGGMIYYALGATFSGIACEGMDEFFPNLIRLSLDYSPSGTAGKVAKSVIKAIFQKASKAVVKQTELIACAPRLTAIYYALGIFWINRVFLKESQEVSEAEGLAVYKKALVAIQKGFISLLC